MNERELSLIKVLGEEFGQVLAEMRDSFSKSIQALKEDYEERLTSLAKQVEEISNAPAPDVESMVKAEIAKLPARAAPEIPDVATMVSEAVAAIPVPRDGKSVTVDDITPFYRSWSAMPWQRYLYQRTVKTLIPPCLNRQLKKLSVRR